MLIVHCLSDRVICSRLGLLNMDVSSRRNADSHDLIVSDIIMGHLGAVKELRGWVTLLLLEK